MPITKYTTKTNPDEMTFGTSLQGHLTATYAELVELFGKPHDFFDDFKCDAEWYIEFDDGTVATIYNWKNGRNYCGPDAPPVEAITHWNVGGHNENALDRVLDISCHYLLNIDRLRRIGAVKLPNGVGIPAGQYQDVVAQLHDEGERLIERLRADMD
jgi:hypothetical protein